MLSLSFSTFRDRWQLFAGAIITVALAVALTQASLLALVTAATADVPQSLPEVERLAISDGYTAAVALLSIVVSIAFFVSVFIVSSTFAFATDQRRRDMALLRLVGASRRQVRRLLLGESVMIGAIGTLIGVPSGVAVAHAQDRMLVELNLVPDGFRTGWHLWIIAVSAGVGIVVAALAAWGAAWRAGRVRPLEAFRGSLRADRVMSPFRWLIGAVAFGGAIAMTIVAPLAGLDGGFALSINICFVTVIAMAAWSPLLVPIVGRVLAGLARMLTPGSPIRDLIGANVRTSVRRTSSTAAPIIVLVGLVAGLGGALAVIQEGMRVEATTTTRSDVIAVSRETITGLLDTRPGVLSVSESIEVAVHVLASDDPDLEARRDTPVAGLAIDPQSYAATHAIDAELTALGPGEIAVTSDLAGRMDVERGDTTPLSVGGEEQLARVGAILPATLGGTVEIWVPFERTAGAAPEAFGNHTTDIVTADGVTTRSVISALTAAGVDARTTDEAIDAMLDDADRQNRSIQIALLGMSALFTMVAIINAVVIATSERREEFATLRLTGLTDRQVVRTALGESITVVATGVALGTVAAAGSILGSSAVVSDYLNQRIVAVPWTLLASSATAIGAIVATTTWITTRSAIRPQPIDVAAACE